MLSAREIDGADAVAVLNEAALKLWPSGEDPLGRRLRLDELEQRSGGNVLTPTNASTYVTIVGVMGDTRNDDLQSDPQPAVLVPYTLLAPPQRTLAIRAQGDAKALMNAVRARVREMDADQPVNGPTTVAEILGFRTAQPRFMMALFSLFAGLGLALALAGIYSVLSWAVARRTREIGVRMALGAQRSEVLGLILRAGGRMVGLGMLLGLLLSLGATRLLRSQLELFQVTMADPMSFSGVALLLGGVAAAACYIPARRATQVDPMEALRCE